MSSLRCKLLGHDWKYVDWEYQPFGMALENFDIFKCSRCDLTGDCLQQYQHRFDEQSFRIRDEK